MRWTHRSDQESVAHDGWLMLRVWKDYAKWQYRITVGEGLNPWVVTSGICDEKEEAMFQCEQRASKCIYDKAGWLDNLEYSDGD